MNDSLLHSLEPSDGLEKSPLAIEPTERASQWIERQLKEAIIKRHYQPGDKLPSERELSQIFKSSRASVREAIRALEHADYVVVKKGAQGGAFVIQKSDSPQISHHLRDMMRYREVTLEEVLQMRLIFEPEVAAEAARKVTEADIDLLESLNHEQRIGFNPLNPAMQHDRNPKFHRLLAEITGNQVFIIIMETLMEIHSFRMNKFELDQSAINLITSQHTDIIAALKKRDSSLACEKVKEHILAVHQLHKQHDRARSQSTGQQVDS